MAILAQCPICRRKQSIRNKRCADCSEDMDKLKRQKEKVIYWIDFRLPGGQQRRERVGYSIKEAKDAMGKRRSQKRENRIFDMLPKKNWNFNQLSKWYLNLDSVKEKKTYDRTKLALNNFSSHFGLKKVQNLIQTDLEDYQKSRKQDGKAPATIDMEFKYAKAAVKKAFINDKIDGRVLRAFENTKLLLVRGQNARTRIISCKEYIRLLSLAPNHLKACLIIAYHTGMRKGEIRDLTWENIDTDFSFIRLKTQDTKEQKPKTIPLNHHITTLLERLHSSSKNEYVINCNNVPIMQKDALKRSLSNTCRLCGIPYGRKVENGLIFHDLRRTFKTNMVQAGISRVARDTIVGHSLKGMDKHYIQLSDNALADAVNTFTQYIDKQLAEAVFSSKKFKSNEVTIPSNSTHSHKLRKELFRRGFRFRIHYEGLPGSPNIIFSKQKVAIFCNDHKENVKSDIDSLTDMGWTTIFFEKSDINQFLNEAIHTIDEALKS